MPSGSKQGTAGHRPAGEICRVRRAALCGEGTTLIASSSSPKETTMIQSTIDVAINPADETIRLGPLVIRFLVAGDDSRGSAAVFECTVPAGEKLRAPAHSHNAYEETIYGLAGVLTWTVDGRPLAVGPGQALCVPRGAVHRFDNLGDRDATAL